MFNGFRGFRAYRAKDMLTWCAFYADVVVFPCDILPMTLNSV